MPRDTDGSFDQSFGELFDDAARERLEADVAHYRAQVRPVAFDAGFADRVMARLAAAARVAPPSLADGLQGVFLRVIPFAAAAALFLGAMNLRNTSASQQPLLDRLLGLPTATVASADALDGDLSQWGQ